MWDRGPANGGEDGPPGAADAPTSRDALPDEPDAPASTDALPGEPDAPTSTDALPDEPDAPTSTDALVDAVDPPSSIGSTSPADASSSGAPAHGRGWDTPADGSAPSSVWSRGPIIDESAPAPVADPADGGPVLPPALPATSSEARVARHASRPATLVVGVALVVVGVLAWSLGLFGGEETADQAIAGDAAAPLPEVPAPTAVPPSSAGPVSSDVVAVASTTTTASTLPDASETVASTTTTSTTSTTTSSTTSSTTTSTTTSSTTSSTTTTVPDADAPAVTDVGPLVDIVGRVGPCKFGPSCLVADFSIVGFVVPQGEFVCDFGGGSRYTFRFDGDGAADACATSAADGTITVEVGGVRSETITR